MYFFSKIKVSLAKSLFGLVKKPSPFVYVGENRINEVGDILRSTSSKKTLVITDRIILELGLLNSMIDKIKSNGIEVIIFDDVTPDPTYDVVNNALASCSGCDCVIAVGGGSVIDTAKVVASAYSNNVSPQDLKGFFKVKKQPLKFICVPTTAGTGSETTIAAVISNPADHSKTLVVDPKLVPDFAILDPALTVGLPKAITVATCMDALTHALESYLSTYATEKTDRLNEMAIKIIFDNLTIVYEKPTDIKARENLLVASFYAGVAFSRTFVGYVHAFSHNIGGKFGVPHGLANSVLLPHIMEYYRDTCELKFSKLYDLLELNYDCIGDSEKAERFILALYEMNKKFGVPDNIYQFEKSYVDEIVSLSFKEAHGTYPVPKYMSSDDAKLILMKVAV
ncbi:iron-containing alcohol dehydrogenase [Vibrio parahaemolyticus]|uniref:iron-containing alcohol dehydrogenase n=1 Tax=Vibrio parahaemolyticus TaxID=670 RepID=UPI001E417D28|nr:iron-containing alcohol dehydrogenase [Vibrio parahaemolyticus]